MGAETRLGEVLVDGIAVETVESGTRREAVIDVHYHVLSLRDEVMQGERQSAGRIGIQGIAHWPYAPGSSVAANAQRLQQGLQRRAMTLLDCEYYDVARGSGLLNRQSGFGAWWNCGRDLHVNLVQTGNARRDAGEGRR
jgi:hypothetical protein